MQRAAENLRSESLRPWRLCVGNFLFIDLTAVFQPTAGVFAAGVAVRPVDDATFVVPFVLAGKINPVIFRKRRNARGNIDVVGNQ